MIVVVKVQRQPRATQRGAVSTLKKACQESCEVINKRSSLSMKVLILKASETDVVENESSVFPRLINIHDRSNEITLADVNRNY